MLLRSTRVGADCAAVASALAHRRASAPRVSRATRGEARSRSLVVALVGLARELGHPRLDQLERELTRGRGRDEDFVLCTRTGRPLSQRNVARALADAADDAGLGKVTPHDLRRSFCSLAARRGVDPVQAARLTGHSLDVFTRVYAGDYGKAQRDDARARMLAHGSAPIAPPIARVALRARSTTPGTEETRMDNRVSLIGADGFEPSTSSPPD